jgi:hypothetical protein
LLVAVAAVAVVQALGLTLALEGVLADIAPQLLVKTLAVANLPQ